VFRLALKKLSGAFGIPAEKAPYKTRISSAKVRNQLTIHKSMDITLCLKMVLFVCCTKRQKKVGNRKRKKNKVYAGEISILTHYS
jgi:hypothetical protein